jgi:IS30 family transposase
MPRKIRGFAKTQLVDQVRESRQEYYDDNWEEMYAPVEEARKAWQEARVAESPNLDKLRDKFDLETQLWEDWNQENIPGTQEAAAKERSRYKKKSKRNERARIEVTDREAVSERVDDSIKKVEWGDWLADGCLVQTKKGAIGMIVANKDVKGYRIADNAVKHGGRVQVMIDGVLQWHKKINLRPLDD